MPRPKKDKVRENRIIYEAVVDAYGAEERAIGWYYYLESKMRFPCAGRCRELVTTSPLQLGEKVELVSLADVDVCGADMFATMNWGSRKLDVPLRQIELVDADEDTMEAIADWNYWIAQGYQF